MVAVQRELIHALAVEPKEIADPGASGAIPIQHSGYVNLVSAAGETRTLADPVFIGQVIDLVFITDGGDVTITVASPIDQTGNNTLVFSNVGEHIRLVGFYNGTDGWEWRSLGTAIATSSVKAFRIPLADVLGADGADLAISETAGDFYRNIGTNQRLILGEVSNGTTEADREVSVGLFEFQLPDNYVAGGTITIRAGVDITGSGAIEASTIDFSAYLQNGISGAIGSDLVTTAATAISATAANKDFVVTPTGLVAGDLLAIKMTTSVSNTDSTAIQAQIAALEARCMTAGAPAGTSGPVLSIV